MSVIWCLRHGERQDYVDPSWVRTAVAPDDTPLARKGHQQALEAATRLKEEKIDHIFCSPFQRCVETANHIAEASGVAVKIEHGICEVLNIYPPGHKRMDELCREYPCIDQNYRSFVVPNRMEYCDSDCFSRVAATVSKIIENYITSPDTSILLVGHGASIAGVTKYLLGRPHYVGLCTLTKIVKTRLKGAAWYPEMISDATHLSDKTNLRAY